MATAPGDYLSRVHLHPLTFELSALDKLDSLSLSLVQFHLDNDEDGFDQVIANARDEWLARRMRAVSAGERFEGDMSDPPAPPPPQPTSLPSRSNEIPYVFHPIVATLRKIHLSNPEPLRAQVGSALRADFSNVFKRDPNLSSFKLYAAEAERRGYVQLGKGDKSGRDWIRLKEPYLSGGVPAQSAPLSPPPPPPPPKPRLPSPLPPSLFHLSSLSFPFSPSTISSLPSHQLLLLQFRDEVRAVAGTPNGQALAEQIEDEFWKRRSAAVDAGQEWQDPPASLFVVPPAASGPHSRTPSANGISAAGHASLPPSRPVSSTSSVLASARGVPTLPSLREELPTALTATLHTLDVSSLPPLLCSTVPSVSSLLPQRLTPTAIILYAPIVPPPSLPLAYPPPPPAPEMRRAHLAFRSPGLAGAAQAHLNALRLVEPATGAGYAVVARPAEKQPRWEWGDVVREEERGEMWRAWNAGAGAGGAKEATRWERERSVETGASMGGGDGKRGREEDEAKRFGEKKPRLSVPDRPPQIVSPTAPVPTSLLLPFYPVFFAFGVAPPVARKIGQIDDAFVHRFGAAGWKEVPPTSALAPAKGMKWVLLFDRRFDADDFQRWVDDLAKRYWKFNWIERGGLGVREVQDLRWQYRDFSPAWRKEQNVELLDGGDGSERAITKTVGEYGDGVDTRVGGRTGWFEWEYKYNGLPQPAAAGSLASRLLSGRAADDDDGSRDSRSRSRSASIQPVEPHFASSTAASANGASLASRLPPRAYETGRSSSPAPASLPHPTPAASALSIRGQASDAASSAPSSTPSSGYPARPPPVELDPAALSPLFAPHELDDDPSFLLEDVPPFGSALAAARLSPTGAGVTASASAFELAGRTRRPIASDLSAFVEEVDVLFAEAEPLLGTAVVELPKPEADEEVVVKVEEEDTVMADPDPVPAPDLAVVSSATTPSGEQPIPIKIEDASPLPRPLPVGPSALPRTDPISAARTGSTASTVATATESDAVSLGGDQVMPDAHADAAASANSSASRDPLSQQQAPEVPSSTSASLQSQPVRDGQSAAAPSLLSRIKPDDADSASSPSTFPPTSSAYSAFSSSSAPASRLPKLAALPSRISPVPPPPASSAALSAPPSPALQGFPSLGPAVVGDTYSRSVSPAATRTSSLSTSGATNPLRSLDSSSSVTSASPTVPHFTLTSEPLRLFPSSASATTKARTASTSSSSSAPPSSTPAAPSSSSAVPPPAAPRAPFDLPSKPAFQAELPPQAELGRGLSPAATAFAQDERPGDGAHGKRRSVEGGREKQSWGEWALGSRGFAAPGARRDDGGYARRRSVDAVFDRENREKKEGRKGPSVLWD
ncbi:hypothetical protein JCM8097_001917 [Rhodosporidiobolus ruineniae]